MAAKKVTRSTGKTTKTVHKRRVAVRPTLKVRVQLTLTSRERAVLDEAATHARCRIEQLVAQIIAQYASMADCGQPLEAQVPPVSDERARRELQSVWLTARERKALFRIARDAGFRGPAGLVRHWLWGYHDRRIEDRELAHGGRGSARGAYG